MFMLRLTVLSLAVAGTASADTLQSLQGARGAVAQPTLQAAPAQAPGMSSQGAMAKMPLAPAIPVAPVMTPKSLPSAAGALPPSIHAGMPMAKPDPVAGANLPRVGAPAGVVPGLQGGGVPGLQGGGVPGLQGGGVPGKGTPVASPAIHMTPLSDPRALDKSTPKLQQPIAKGRAESELQQKRQLQPQESSNAYNRATKAQSDIQKKDADTKKAIADNIKG